MPNRPNRAVVDTNILVSALYKRGSPPHQVELAIRSGALLPVVCEEIMAEYNAVLRRPRLGLSQRDVVELTGLLAAQAQWVRITPYPGALKLPDTGDWPFVATALAADCPVITGNAKHFPKRLGVVVMTAREWVDA